MASVTYHQLDAKVAAATLTDDVIGDDSVGLALMAQIHQEYPIAQVHVVVVDQSNILEQLVDVNAHCCS